MVQHYTEGRMLIAASKGATFAAGGGPGAALRGSMGVAG